MDVKSYVAKALQDLGRGLERYLDGLAEEEVHWVPQSGAASITDHLFHAARFEDEFVQRRVLGRPELWAAPDSTWLSVPVRPAAGLGRMPWLGRWPHRHARFLVHGQVVRGQFSSHRFPVLLP